MALNAKILLDPKFYYQKLKELSTKTRQTFSQIGTDVKSVFSAIRGEISGMNVSFGKFAKSILLGGGALSLIQKGIQSVFSLLDAHMKNLKAQITDAMESMGDLANQYSSFDKQQLEKSGSNKNALSTLSDLQMSDSPLSNVQKEQQRQAVDTLRKSYHDLNVEIDAASGKIKNFQDIQSRVLSGDQKKELNNVRRQIKALEKQNGIAAGAVQYKGGTFSEYWENMKETYGWGAAQEAGGVQKQNVEKLMALRRREFQLTHSDRAGDANSMYQAKMKDRADRLADPGNVAAKKYAIDEQIRETEKKLKSVQSKKQTSPTADDTAEESRLQERLSMLRKQREDLPKTKQGNFEENERRQLEIQQLINQGKTEEAKALKLIYELEKQGVYLSKEKAKEIIKSRQQVASATYYKDTIQDLENQVQIQGMILEGKTEEAKRQQIINELKKRGLKYDEARVNRIMELNRQLGALNLRNSQKKEAESLYDRALRMAGRTKEADQSAALRRARDIKGSDLTKAEEKNTLAMVELTHSIQDLSRAFGLTGDLSIRTNDLTRRGGFQSGAAVPNISRFELLSLERMQQINAMLRDIRQKMNQFKGTF